MATGFRNLQIFRKAFHQAMAIYDISKELPFYEKSLRDQINRSARSVCACIGEAYQKRRYPAHFISKLSDADMENTETQVWLDFLLHTRNITVEKYKLMVTQSEEIGKLLNYMMLHPTKFQRKY